MCKSKDIPTRATDWVCWQRKHDTLHAQNIPILGESFYYPIEDFECKLRLTFRAS